MTLTISSNTNMLAKPGTMAVGLAVVGFDDQGYGDLLYTMLEVVFDGMIWDARTIWGSCDKIDEEFFAHDVDEARSIQLLHLCTNPLYFRTDQLPQLEIYHERTSSWGPASRR